MRLEHNYKESSIGLLNLHSDHFWFKHRNNIIAESLDRYVKAPKSNSRLLELGAGSGCICRFLKIKCGYTVDASDVFASALPYFKNVVNNAFLFDIESDTIPDRLTHAYDALILGDVLEHLDEPGVVLEKLQNFLKSTGVVVVTVPALVQLWTPYEKFYGHRRRYTKRDLELTLRAASYEVISVRYFMFIPSLIIFFMRKLETMTKNKYNMHVKELSISGVFNHVMNAVMRVEYAIGKLLRFPFGSSLICVARKPSNTSG
jgi:2-polyprenyl-3-methyl-5-hydroxy-6-metoxy-1,4-benzoquinol methylase